MVLENIWFEKVGNLSYVVRLQFLLISAGFYFKIDVEEVFRSIILIHPDVLECKVDDDVVIG